LSKFSFDAVVFDLDGVITTTAKVHATSWKMVFDEYLHFREEKYNEPYKEFTIDGDYLQFVDGKPRYDGVKSFLKSRNIRIPFGAMTDPSDRETVCGIGNKKNDTFRTALDKEGADVYPSTIAFINSLHEKGIKVGVASSSRNCLPILQNAGIEHLFETRVDGEVSLKLHLNGKPEPDIFVLAAKQLGTIPARAVVVEDASSGVRAGRNGGFGLVLGIARKDNVAELNRNGADVVVCDMEGVTLGCVEEWFHKTARPLSSSWDTRGSQRDLVGMESEMKCVGTINPCYFRPAKWAFFGKKKPVIFLDYDGTLTPIVERPELAVISEDMRQTVKQLAEKYTVAIVSGRMREDVQNLLGIENIFYAGSHGFDIAGPGFSMVQHEAEKTIHIVDKVIVHLKKELGTIDGVIIEEKKFSVAVHYRLVDEKHLPQIIRVVEEVVKSEHSLRLMNGKKVFEILPNIEWDKGKAIRWIMSALKITWLKSSVIYIGDDVTDENAFRFIRTRGTGILVDESTRPSAADFQVSIPDEVKTLFEKIISSS